MAFFSVLSVLDSVLKRSLAFFSVLDSSLYTGRWRSLASAGPSASGVL